MAHLPSVAAGGGSEGVQHRCAAVVAVCGSSPLEVTSDGTSLGGDEKI